MLFSSLSFPSGCCHLNEGGDLTSHEAVPGSLAQGLRGFPVFPSNSFFLYFLSDMKRGLF